MKNLSFGANLVWQLAAQGVAADRHQYIEPEHLLIGICSLEKIHLSGVADDLDFSQEL